MNFVVENISRRGEAVVQKLFRNKILFSVLVSIVVTLLASTFGKTTYSENDDSLMQLIADGTITGTPNPYLYLTSTKIGSFLNLLYNHNIDINWYFYYLLCCYALFSSFLIYYILDNNKKNLVFKIFISLLITSMALFKIQFTIIAILLSFLSFNYFLLVTKRKKAFLNSSIACLLLVLAGLIRFDVVFIFAILFMPILFIHSLRQFNFISILTSLLIMSVLLVNNSLEKSELSRLSGFDLDKYIESTETIIDNPNNIQEPDLIALGLDENDLSLIKSYFFIDVQVFNYENIVKLSEGKKHYRGLKSIMMILFFSLYNAWGFIIPMVILIFTSNFKEERKIFVLFMFLNVLLALSLIIFVRFPYHISSSLVLMILYFIILKSDILVIKKGWVVVMLLFVGLYVYVGINENSFKNQRFEEFFTYFDDNKDKLYQITMFTDIPLEALSGPNSKLNNRSKNYLYFGWLVGTPAYNDHIDCLFDKGELLSKNQFVHLINDKKTILVSNNASFNSQIILFAKTHYKMDVKFVLESQLNGTNFYSISSNKIIP